MAQESIEFLKAGLVGTGRSSLNHGDITAIMAAWRTAVELGDQGWRPLPVSCLVPGDTVYGFIEENDDAVQRVVMFAQPFTIARIDDNFWRRGENTRDRRVLHSDNLTHETHLDGTTRVIAVTVPTAT